MSKLLADQVIEDAIALLCSPHSWRQNNIAVNGRNLPVPGPLVKEAVAWCLDGALQLAAAKYGSAALEMARNRVCAYAGLVPNQQSIWTWNDAKGRSHEEVLGLLRGALAA